MSWRATSAVKALRANLTRSEKFLLLILADYHNDETDQCNPSVERLGYDALMSRRQTVRLLESLDRKGFIATESRRNEAGQQNSNQYNLLCLGGDTMTLPQAQSDISDAGGVTFPTRGGDTAMSPKPSVEPSLRTTATAGARDAIMALLVEEHERTIGLLGSVQGEIWREWPARIPETEIGRAWVQYAFREAAANESRPTVKYIERILERGEAEGWPAEMEGLHGRRNAQDQRHPGRRDKGTAASGPDLGPWRRYAAGER